MLPATEKAIFLDNAILECAKKKDTIKHNMGKAKAIRQPIAPIVSEGNCAAAKSESADQAAGLPMKTIISKNTIFRLTANLWTEAGLTNGSEGVTDYIIYDSQKIPPSLPVAIIATFNSYIGPPFLPGLANSVPICPVTTDWHSQKMNLTRMMLPIILGYALSIHKLQGNTSERLILNARENEFAAGRLLVGCTRTKTFQGLYFILFPTNERFLQISKSSMLTRRKEQGERLKQIEHRTIEEYRNAVSADYEE